jgi:Leucine-rich repeat (LRR) protein
MNPALKILLYILVLGGGCQCNKQEQSIKISDDKFLSSLINQGIDKNGDGIISPAEAEVITTLNLAGDSISDMKGIEIFVNLSKLDCASNQLTSLDLSENPALKELNCNCNQLTSLIVSNNTSLRILRCSNNPLSGLDVSDNTALEYLYCENNQLIALDVSKNMALKTIYCGSNRLTTLNVSKNAGLHKLNIMAMSSLFKVCVWKIPFPSTNVEVNTSGSPNVYYSIDCRK